MHPAVSRVFHRAGFSESRFFRVHVFLSPGFYWFQVFQGPGLSEFRFFWLQVFQGPGFSGSGSRVRVQGLSPGFRSSLDSQAPVIGTCIVLIVLFIDAQALVVIIYTGDHRIIY